MPFLGICCSNPCCILYIQLFHIENMVTDLLDLKSLSSQVILIRTILKPTFIFQEANGFPKIKHVCQRNTISPAWGSRAESGTVYRCGQCDEPRGWLQQNSVIKPQGGGEPWFLSPSARGTYCDLYFYSFVYFLSYLKSILISIVIKEEKIGLSTRESH